MERERLIKKYLPVQSYDMAGLEEWLSAMAAQGLHLATIDSNRASFRSGPPCPGARYALEVTGPVDIDRARNEDYAQMGWDYVTTLMLSPMVSMYYVYRSEDPGAPPLHTDPVTQSTTVAKLVRRMRRTLILMIVLLAVVLRNALTALFSDPWSAPRFFLLYTERAALWLLVMVPYALSVLVPSLRRMWGLGRVRRRLAAGIPLEREERRRRIPSSVLGWGLTVLVVVCAVCSVLAAPNRSRALSGPEEWTFPHVTLEQALEGSGAGDITPESPYDKRLHKDSFRSSLLCPEQYSWDQVGEAVFDGVAQEVTVSIDYYRAASPQLARLLLPCLLADQEKGLRDYQKQQDKFVNPAVLTVLSPFRQVAVDGTDEAWMMEFQRNDDPVTLCWFGRKGDQVFRLLCRGLPDPARCLELLTEQLGPQPPS